MSNKKSALYKGNNSKHKHLIEQLEDNSICVTADSTKAQLRLLAKHCGFDYDDNWNTRTLGAKFIDFLHEKDSNSVMLDDNAKKMATVLDKDEQGNLFKHTIEQSANSENENTITVTADSTKAVLRLIFNDMGVAYDNDWNTQTMGAKLIELINNQANNNNINSENNDWQWWTSLTESMRYVLIYQIHLEDMANLLDYYTGSEDDEYYMDILDSESGITDYMENFLSLTSLNVSEISQSEEGSDFFEFNGFEKLAYLPNLTELNFSNDSSLTFLPTGLDQLSKLKHLNFSYTDLGFDDPDSDFETLIEIANALPKLEFLNLSSTPLAQWLDNEQIDELKELMPNCDIEV